MISCYDDDITQELEHFEKMIFSTDFYQLNSVCWLPDSLKETTVHAKFAETARCVEENTP